MRRPIADLLGSILISYDNDMTKKFENRVYKRVQFFMVPAAEHEIRPIWVFNSQNPGNSLAGLVANMSESGIQVLTGIEEMPENTQYRLTFLMDENAGEVNLPDCHVQWVWSEPAAGLYTRSGFTFVNELEASLKALLDRVGNGEQLYLRCALEEVDFENEQLSQTA